MKCFARKQDVLDENDFVRHPTNGDLTRNRWFRRARHIRLDDKHASAPAASSVPEPVEPGCPSTPITPQLRANASHEAPLHRTSSSISLVGFTSISASFHTAPSLGSDFVLHGDYSATTLSPASSIDPGLSQPAQTAGALEFHGHGHSVGHHRKRRTSSFDAWSHDDTPLQQRHTTAIRPKQSLQQPLLALACSTGEGLDAQLNLAWPTVHAMIQDSRWIAADSQIQQLEQATGIPRTKLPQALESCGQGIASEIETNLQYLQAMLQGMHTFETALAETDRYHQSSQKPLQIFYRRNPQATVHQFRFVADFAASLVEVLALAREFDLISSWNWTVPDSRILSERSDMDLSAFAVVRMPWPFNNRYATVRAQGGDCLQEDSCARVVFASCACDEVPESARHADRVEVLEGSGVRLEPCWMHQHGHIVEGCRVSVQLSADPKVDVPAAIIKFILTVLSPVVYRLTKHVIHAYVRKPGSALHTRMQQRRSFYNDVDSKVQKFLASCPAP
eukprot:jgi/Ulvmu1/10369/UM061_0052.1